MRADALELAECNVRANRLDVQLRAGGFELLRFRGTACWITNIDGESS